MTDLFVVTREFDLPPKWDGRTVEWTDWEPRTAQVFICPPPKPEPCTRCKSTAPSLSCIGTVNPLPGEMYETDRVKRTKSGREYVSGTIARPAYATIRLHVFRCPDCLFDTVWDIEADEWWDLDPTDYEADGSVAP